MYFVIQKRHRMDNDTWDNGIVTKTTQYEAIHQFHAFMSTYGYGYGENFDYVACAIEDEFGVQEKVEVDDRRSSMQEIQGE